MKREHFKYVKMEWKHGEEAICVSCGHNNAMLHTGHIGDVTFYECRDCHVVVAYQKGHVYEDGSKEPDVGRIIGRSIGKTCSECHSFVDKWFGHGEMDKESKSGYYCTECGKYWGN